MTVTDAERIARLEVRIDSLVDIVNSMAGKQDELLALKQKGVGAFWLASTLLGTGIVGAFSTFFYWLKG